MSFTKRACQMGAALTMAGTLWASGSVAAAPFTSGNIVVYRVGGSLNPATPGASGLTAAGNPVFLDEYTPTGTYLQSFSMPILVSGSNKALFAANGATNAATEGLLTRSANTFCLAVPGYGSNSTTATRVIARVTAAGTIDTTTAFTESGISSTFRGAATSDCNAFWMTSASDGLRYASALGASTSTSIAVAPTATRVADIFGGQLFVTSNTTPYIGISQVGSSLPTATQTPVRLAGFTDTTATQPYGYLFAKLDSNSAGYDTLYLADSTKGILKFALVAGSWVQVGGAIGAGEAHRGFVGTVSGTTVSLYAVKGGSTTAATGGGVLVKVIDTAGYNVARLKQHLRHLPQTQRFGALRSRRSPLK
jgi:hypothetical protein